MPNVPRRTTTAMTRLVTRRRVAKRRTGTYRRWSGLPLSLASAARRSSSGSVPSGISGARRNQYERTGTTVRETRRDARRATVTVMEKDPNRAPTMPPTTPMGRKTATVVRVEEVIAPETSRTALRIAARRSSP